MSRALAALREAGAPLAPEGRAQLSRMAPGVGGFNIDPSLRSRQIGGPVAFERRLRARRLVISEPSVASETRKEASSHTDASAQPQCSNHQLADGSRSRPHRVLPEPVSSARSEPRIQPPRMAPGIDPRPLRTAVRLADSTH